MQIVGIVKWRVEFVIGLAYDENDERAAEGTTINLALFYALCQRVEFLGSSHVECETIEQAHNGCV